MKKTLIVALIATLFSCTKEHSYTGNCGIVLQKIHEVREPRNDIWLLAVSVTDSTERLVGVDSARFVKINIGDKYCD